MLTLVDNATVCRWCHEPVIAGRSVKINKAGEPIHTICHFEELFYALKSEKKAA